MNLELKELETKVFKYNIVFDVYPDGSFTPSFIRENRRHVVIENCIKLCKKVISDIGVNDKREEDYLLAKVGMAILGQSMLGLQNQVVEMDHESDIALEANFGKLSDYLKSPSNETKHGEVIDDVNKTSTDLPIPEKS